MRINTTRGAPEHNSRRKQRPSFLALCLIGRRTRSQDPVVRCSTRRYRSSHRRFRSFFPRHRAPCTMFRAALRRQLAQTQRRSASTSANGGSSQPEMSPQVKAAVESAQKAYESAVGGAKRVAGPVGDSVGRLLGGESFVFHKLVAAETSASVRLSQTHSRSCDGTGYREPLVYNWKVFTSLCRQVYIAEKLAPPTSLSTWVHAYAKIWSRATSPAYYRQIAQSGEWSKVAVYVSQRIFPNGSGHSAQSMAGRTADTVGRR